MKQTKASGTSMFLYLSSLGSRLEREWPNSLSWLYTGLFVISGPLAVSYVGWVTGWIREFPTLTSPPSIIHETPQIQLAIALASYSLIIIALSSAGGFLWRRFQWIESKAEEMGADTSTVVMLTSPIRQVSVLMGLGLAVGFAANSALTVRGPDMNPISVIAWIQAAGEDFLLGFLLIMLLWAVFLFQIRSAAIIGCSMKLKSFAESRMLGLEFLGENSVYASLISLLVLEGVLWRSFLYQGAFTVILQSTVIFSGLLGGFGFLPLWRLHTVLAKEKHEQLNWINQRYSRIIADIRSKEDMTIDPQTTSEVLAVRKIHEDISKVRTWPTDAGVLWKVVPILISLLTLPIIEQAFSQFLGLR